MKKLFKAFAVLIITAASTNTFAQEFPPASETGLKDKDVQCFIKYNDKLTTEVSALNIELLDTDTPAMMLEKLQASKELDALLKKVGISGDNRSAKFLAFIFGMSYLSAKKTVETDPRAIAELEAAGATKEEFLAQFNYLIAPKDRAVMDKYADKIIKAFNL